MPVSLSEERRFPRRRTSVGASRDFVARVLAEWELGPLTEDIRLCVSELATNALVHGVPPGREFSVTLSCADGLLRLGVRDSGPGRPVVRPIDELSCSGRGSVLVRELADEFEVDCHTVGKTVWLSFKIPTAST